MNVLMIDVGGSNIKCMNAAEGEVRKLPSGKEMNASRMVKEVLSATSDWHYDVISIGYPGLMRKGRPVRDPLNLGEGWVHFAFEQALGKPTRMINDAAMQALGNYTHGRLLFLGFGTSIGTCLIADDVVIPIEIGLIKFTKGKRFMDKLSKSALKKSGVKAWVGAVEEAVEVLRDVFQPDEVVLGGGNSELIEKESPECRLVKNHSAYLGAERLWEHADIFALPDESTWKIIRGSRWSIRR